MTNGKKLSSDDSERFILPDGEVLTRDQMEAMLKRKAEYYLDLGRLSEQDGNFEDAVRYYSQAFTMPEGSNRVWYFLNKNLGLSLRGQGRFLDAAASFLIASMSCPGDGRAMSHWGRCSRPTRNCAR